MNNNLDFSVQDTNQNLYLDEGFQIEKYWKIIKPKLHIVIFITIFMAIATFIKVSSKVPMYYSSGLLLIEPEKNVVNFDRFSFQDWRNEYYNTQIRILRSRSLTKEVMEELSTTSDPPVGILNISPVEFTRLVNVSYRSSDPETAANMVNTLFEKFIEFNLDVKTRSSKQASEFITKQITRLQRSLTDKEKELQKYGKRKELFYLSTGSRASTIVDKFSDLNKAYTQAQIKRVNKEAVFQELKSLNFADYPQVKRNPLISSLKNTYSSFESDYKKKSQIFKESYPEMSQLKSQMETLQQRIHKEIQDIAAKTFKEAQSEYQSELKREKSLLSLLNEQKGVVINSKTDAIYYNSLNIEVQNMRRLLDFLVKKQKESLLSSRLEGMQSSNIKVIDRAEVPRFPMPSKKLRSVFVSIILGLALSIGLIFLVDYLDRTIKDPEQIKSLLRVPALGIIPAPGSKKNSSYSYFYGYGKHSDGYGKKRDNKKNPEMRQIELINFVDPECPYSENYRNIRTSILLSTPKEPPKVITITSALPSEGKTVTVANLSISFSQLGKKVLIIDGDLRKPRMHKIFRLKNTAGLSTFLAGETELSEIVQKTHIPNLFVIPSGSIPPNPVELIDSEVMKEMLKKVQEGVDFIFIDTPPLIGIVDPIILGKHADGIILVTWGGKTNRNMVKKAKEEIDRFNIRTFGVVLNRVDFRKERYGYDYYRKYNYQYKYTEKEEDN